MNQELEKLFKEIVAVNGKSTTDGYMHKWTKLCLKHDFKVVKAAWDNMSENCPSWQYYELNVWKQQIEYQQPRIDKDEKSEYLKIAHRMKKWTNQDKDNWNENSRRWDEREQTYREYLENGKKIGQMNESDVAKEMIRYERLGKNLDDYKKSDLMKGVKYEGSDSV